jgi:VWFA-related protein
MKLSSDLVVLDARVIKKQSRHFVGGLAKEDFELYEDGKKQSITHFSQDNPPVSIVFLLNLFSFSNPSVINQLRTGLSESLKALRNEDEAALMASGCAKIWLLQDFTKDKSLLAAALNDLAWNNRLEGWEPRMAPMLDQVYAGNHRAIYEAAIHLNKASSNPVLRRAIIAVTDEVPWRTHVKICDKQGAYAPSVSRKETRSKDEIFRQLFSSGTIVSALVALDPYQYSASLRRNLRILEKFGAIGSVFTGYNRWDFADAMFYVERTGGEALLVNETNAVTQLGGLISHLYKRYSFGYVSSNEKRDGRFRKIKLRLSRQVHKREGELVVVTRDGYYAPVSDGSATRKRSKGIH